MNAEGKRCSPDPLVLMASDSVYSRCCSVFDGATMGKHQKGPGLSAINMLERLGQALDYHVRLEEPMFPGNPSTPYLDVTWRRDQQAKFPLFIFEVESHSTKSAADNAVKVFSRRTPSFQKPLFFFHVFIEQRKESARIDYLADSYDKHNYASYVFSDPADRARFLRDVLGQHLLIGTQMNLIALLSLIENERIVAGEINDVLAYLVDVEYDRRDNADFLLALETLILDTQSQAITNFYQRHLPRYLSYEPRPSQHYLYQVAVGYSEVVHRGLLLLLDDALSRDDVFNQLQRLDADFEPWPLWAPYFGLSRDHDLVLLSEFPLLLTLLCLAFRRGKYGSHFSQKLSAIASEVASPDPITIHSFVWLLIASRLSGDVKSYEFARKTINAAGGIPMELVLSPSGYVDEDGDERMLTGDNRVTIPPFHDWADWIGLTDGASRALEHLLAIVLDSFLVMHDPARARSDFAQLCLSRSIQEH